MNLDESDGNINGHANAARIPRVQNEADEIKHAYWIQRTIREAIYGRVLFAVILKRRPRNLVLIDGAEWEVTPDHCAVKEMSWQHIRREQDRLAEDPIKEVSSMQYLSRWWRQMQQCKNQQQQFQQAQQMGLGNQLISPLQPRAIDNHHADVTESFFVMRDTNIMMPLDLLSDERNLYSIMPYCDGGELFERLDLNERFSEDEARYWMDQVLNVSSMFGLKISGYKYFFLTLKMYTFGTMAIVSSLLRLTVLCYHWLPCLPFRVWIIYNK